VEEKERDSQKESRGIGASGRKHNLDKLLNQGIPTLIKRGKKSKRREKTFHREQAAWTS